MITSMTAYGSAEFGIGRLAAAVEIRSYNSRYLDISLKMPARYSCLEDRIRHMVSDRINRGRVEIRLSVEDDEDSAAGLEIDEARARSLGLALDKLKSGFGLEPTVSMEYLFGAGGVVKAAVVELDVEKHWQVMEPCIRQALDALTAMRETEGGTLADDIAGRIDTLEQGVADISVAAEGLAGNVQERLTERIAELTRGVVEIDPDRVAQEAAHIADRGDISEEIVRMNSHLTQFRSIMAAPEPAGRKLNFLLQELNRELNTMGSKAGGTEITRIVVDLKADVEKIREQVQNVE